MNRTPVLSSRKPTRKLKFTYEIDPNTSSSDDNNNNTHNEYSLYSNNNNNNPNNPNNSLQPHMRNRNKDIVHETLRKLQLKLKHDIKRNDFVSAKETQEQIDKIKYEYTRRTKINNNNKYNSLLAKLDDEYRATTAKIKDYFDDKENQIYHKLQQQESQLFKNAPRKIQEMKSKLKTKYTPSKQYNECKTKAKNLAKIKKYDEAIKMQKLAKMIKKEDIEKQKYQTENKIKKYFNHIENRTECYEHSLIDRTNVQLAKLREERDNELNNLTSRYVNMKYDIERLRYYDACNRDRSFDCALYKTTKKIPEWSLYWDEHAYEKNRRNRKQRYNKYMLHTDNMNKSFDNSNNNMKNDYFNDNDSSNRVYVRYNKSNNNISKSPIRNKKEIATTMCNVSCNSNSNSNCNSSVRGSRSSDVCNKINKEDYYVDSKNNNASIKSKWSSIRESNGKKGDSKRSLRNNYNVDSLNKKKDVRKQQQLQDVEVEFGDEMIGSGFSKKSKRSGMESKGYERKSKQSKCEDDVKRSLQKKINYFEDDDDDDEEESEDNGSENVKEECSENKINYANNNNKIKGNINRGGIVNVDNDDDSGDDDDNRNTQYRIEQNSRINNSKPIYSNLFTKDDDEEEEEEEEEEDENEDED